MNELIKFNEPIVTPGVINCDLDTVIKRLKEFIKSYQGLVYTEENLKQAKEDRAMFNKLLKDISKLDTTTKEKVLENFNNSFKPKTNEAKNIIVEVLEVIDSTIKYYENEEKKQKKKKIEDFYKESIGDLKSILPFEELFKDTYLNKSVSMKKIKTEMLDVINSTVSDLEVIDTSTSKYKINAKDVYLRTRDLKRAMNEIARLEEFDKRMAEAEAKKRAEEEARRKAEEEAKAKAEEEAKRMAEENARLAAEAEARRLAEEEARAKAEAQAKIEADIAKAEADRLAAEAALRAAEEQRIKAEEEAKRRAEAEQAKKLEESNDNVTFLPKPTVVIPPAKQGEKVYRVKIMIDGTMEQIEAIGNILSSNGITFRDL